MEIKKLNLLIPSIKNHFAKIDKKITIKGGIYILFNKKLEIIYIGKTNNIRHRIQQHCSLKSSRALNQEDKVYLTRVPYGEVEYYLSIKINSELDKSMYEMILINLFKPKYNL